MAKCPAAVCIFKRQELDLAVLFHRCGKIYRLIIHLRSQDLFSQAVAEILYKIKYTRALLNFTHSTVFQCYLYHVKTSSKNKNSFVPN